MYINGTRISIIRSAHHEEGDFRLTLHQVIVMNGGGALKGYVLQREPLFAVNDDAPARYRLQLVPAEEVFQEEEGRHVLCWNMPENFKALIRIEEIPFTRDRYNVVDAPLTA